MADLAYGAAPVAAFLTGGGKTPRARGELLQNETDTLHEIGTVLAASLMNLDGVCVHCSTSMSATLLRRA